MTAPRAEEFDFVRLLTLPAIVGKDLFRRSYLIYTILLVILFLFLCLSKPFVPNFIGNIPEYQGGAWPLGCALLVVGLLPSVKGVDQIEEMLRRFALSASNIPDEFFRRAKSLSQSELKGFLEREQKYQPELSKYWKVYNLVTATGAMHEDAHNAARRTVGNELFGRWTIDGGSIWSPGEYEKLKDVFDVLRPKVKGLKREVDELIGVTSSSKTIIYLLTKGGIRSSQPVTREQAQRLLELSAEVSVEGANGELTATDLEGYLTLGDRWREKSDELSISNRRLCALFAILALNDRAMVKEYLRSSSEDRDSILREMFALVNKVRQYTVHPVYNATLVAGAGAFVVSFVIFFLFRITADYISPPDPARLKAFEYALYTTVAIMACFTAAGLAALFIRASRVEQGKWIFFDSFLRFPMLQYRGIVVAATVCAFVPFVISTMAYAFRAGDIHGFADLTRYGSASFIIFCIAWCLIPMTFAVGLCVVTDVIDRQHNSRFTFVSIASALLVLATAAIVHQTYASMNESYRAIFWNGLVSTGSFASTGLLIFGYGLSEALHQNSSDKPSETSFASS